MGCGATGETEGETVGEILQKEETVSGLASGGGIEVGEVEGETEGETWQKEETVSVLLPME